MWTKICGNTNLEDAKLAADLGADAVGFIFAPSRRQVMAAQVAEIARRLPESVERVGVFDSHDAEEIALTAREAKLHAVQLHGGFEEKLLRALVPLVTSSDIQIVQTLHWRADSPQQSDEIAGQLLRVAALGVADRVLIDSKIGASPSGGTGVAFDWNAARNLFALAPVGIKLIVAGGLSPENVAGAIRGLMPFGVDVSSGVEATVGRKNPAKVAAFIRNARAADLP